jgi:hypothetical protein
VVHRTIRCAPDSVRCQAGAPGDQAALRKKLGRRNYNSPDCPVCQPRAWLTVGYLINYATCAQPTVTRLHRTIRCATGLFGVPWDKRLATVGFTKQGIKSRTVHCPVVYRTVRCAHGQKSIKAYQMELQRLLGPLGL